jgi:NADH-quinone oxidoreductase subunit E
MMVNWEFMDNMTPQSATDLVDDLREGKEVRSTRGPRITTWREVERVLAGFPDDLADEGPAAGPASLVGLELARERGWTAPHPESSGEIGSPADTPAESAELADTSRAEAETKQEEGHDA